MSFTNPYPGCRKSGTSAQVMTRIGIEDYRYLQSCRPGTGTITVTVNLLLKKLVEQLQARSTKISRKEYEQLVADAILKL